MSNRIHCDGPGCEQFRPNDTPYERARIFQDAAWIRVETRPDSVPLDFHSHECLAAWNALSTSSTTVVDGR